MQDGVGSLTPDQWDKVVELFHQARKRAPEERDGFLARACAGDERLRREVDALLEEDGDTGGFFNSPPLTESREDETPAAAATGEVDHYTLITKLGEGGMGTVYKAWDHRLDRLVALKFLSPRLHADPEMKERFVREAKTTSALDHPNICTIYEIDETVKGELYIAMAFYEGQTVRQMIHESPLAPPKAIDIAVQAARGLSKAHSLGIVHRDLKPANIIVTPDGLAKVLDFGIAKLGRGMSLTRTGMTVGTVAYMSPEQARGRAVDQRTDVWALGVALYEMLTGRTPFAGENDLAVLYSIVNEDPRPASAPQQDWPAGLAGILEQALEKDAARRYQTMEEMAADLVASGAGRDPGSATRRIAEIRKSPTIVVLPFANLSRDPEYELFGDGLTEELISALSHVEGIQVVSRTTAFQFKGKPLDVREIGRQLKVSTALEGSVRASGNKARIVARLVNVADGYQLWFGRFDREVDDVFAAQDEIAQAIVSTLKERFRAEDVQPLVTRPTGSGEAYRLFLKGRHYCGNWSQASLNRGIELYRQALDLEPSFAQAWMGVAEAHLLQGFWGFLSPHEAWPNARTAAEEALKRNDKLEAAHGVRAAVLAVADWDWDGAGREFDRALAAGGEGDPMTLQWYSSFYLLPLGRAAEALEAQRKALEMDPLSPGLHATVAWRLAFTGQIDEAAWQAREGIDLAPDFLEGYWALASTHLMRRDAAAAVQTLERAIAIAPENSFTLAQLVRALTAANRPADALRFAEQLENLNQRTFVAPSHLAIAKGALGRKDEALDDLERACDIREVLVLYLRTLPAFDRLRHDSRFEALARRMGLPE